MRIILILWGAPLAFFWGWYGLSAYDINFGTIFLSRQLHDMIFQIYGNSIGVPAADVPAMIAGACAFDTAIVMSIAAWRWRKGWVPQTMAGAERVRSWAQYKWRGDQAGYDAPYETTGETSGPTRPGE